MIRPNNPYGLDFTSYQQSQKSGTTNPYMTPLNGRATDSGGRIISSQQEMDEYNKYMDQYRPGGSLYDPEAFKNNYSAYSNPYISPAPRSVQEPTSTPTDWSKYGITVGSGGQTIPALDPSWFNPMGGVGNSSNNERSWFNPRGGVGNSSNNDRYGTVATKSWALDGSKAFPNSGWRQLGGQGTKGAHTWDWDYRPTGFDAMNNNWAADAPEGQINFLRVKTEDKEGTVVPFRMQEGRWVPVQQGVQRGYWDTNAGFEDYAGLAAVLGGALAGAYFAPAAGGSSAAGAAGGSSMAWAPSMGATTFGVAPVGAAEAAMLGASGLTAAEIGTLGAGAVGGTAAGAGGVWNGMDIPGMYGGVEGGLGAAEAGSMMGPPSELAAGAFGPPAELAGGTASGGLESLYGAEMVNPYAYTNPANFGPPADLAPNFTGPPAGAAGGNGGLPSWVNRGLDIADRLMGSGGRPGIIPALYGQNAQRGYAKDMLGMAGRWEEMAAPYMDALRKSYTDPQSYFNSPDVKARLDLEADRYTRNDAAGGRLSNDIGRTQLLQKYAAQDIGNYREGLNRSINSVFQPNAIADLFRRGSQADNSQWGDLMGYFGRGGTISGGIKDIIDTGKDIWNVGKEIWSWF